MALKFVKPERVWLANNPEYRETWVQDRIAEDPSILGLGDIVLKDKERNQPHGGRLDLLFQDAESSTRYEVEVMLGSTDESHIIRTIEYWDVERKRYPQYDHYAVIVAEDITGRFLNVIGLFNGSIKLIALQMSAWKFGDQISLVFTKVIDAVALGMPDEDEEVQTVTDRSYWESRGTKETVALADEMLALIKTFAPELELKYNKFYIGLAKDNQPHNFAIFKAKKNSFRAEMRVGSSPNIDQELEAAGIDVMDYDSKWKRYRLRLTKNDIKKHPDLLLKLLKMAYGHDTDSGTNINPNP